MERDNGAAYLGIGMIAGVALGLAIGLLYAPQPGVETRAMLKQRATELKEKAGEITEEVKIKASEMMHRAKEGPGEAGSCG
jgi:gas vesicle protein